MTGLRPGELLGLHWDDVDLHAGTLDVTGSLKREGSTLRLGDVKGGLKRAREAARPTGPGRGGIARSTEPHSASRGSSWDLTGRTTAWCSPTEVGTPVHPSGMNRKLARVTERAGVGALVDDRAEPALGRLAPVR